MQDPEMHDDLSDDADYAASQLQGSITSRSDSGMRSSSGDSDGAEVIYLKDNVTIHPTQFGTERISGRLKLIKQKTSLFMTWIPYKGETSNTRLSEEDRKLYTIRAVPFSDVRSIRRHTPTLSWQYIIVVLSSGLAYPPMYFYNGGVKEFLATIKLHVFVVRSADDANVFLVNDFQDPLQKTLSSLELPRFVSVANVPSTSFLVHDSSSIQHGENDDRRHAGGPVSSQHIRRPRPRVHDPARDLSIQVLEKFSLVTKFAREATSQLFHDSISESSYDNWRENGAESLYNHPLKESTVKQEVSDIIAVAPDPVEFDKLSLIWGKPRQPPLGSIEWSTFMDSEGRVTDSKALRKRIFYGGVDDNHRKEVWTFLLGYHTYGSTFAEREYLTSLRKSEYETIKQQWKSISAEQAKRFTKFKERKGLIEKDVVRTDRSLSFYAEDENPNISTLHDILLTYSFYNFDLGYCQGMSDLLSPILYVIRDESDSFWCFAHLMERLGPNFNRDQSGMHSQLFALSKLVELLDVPLHGYFKQNDCLNYFFCFRWILIQFKREFEYEKTLRLWEVLWTHHLSEHVHLYVCVAILKRYRGKIMGEQMDFDTLLKFINELSGNIDLDAVLRDAEALLICAGENGAACIPPGTPPSLPLEETAVFSQEDDVL